MVGDAIGEGLAITGVLLAGGQARRMGREDKGLIELKGQLLIEHVLGSLSPVLSEWVISANRNHARYAAYGWPVVSDQITGYCGPLAGIAAAIEQSKGEAVLSVPCDAPFVGAQLVTGLVAALAAGTAEIAVAHDGCRLQPTFALYRVDLLSALQHYLLTGGRKIDQFFAQHQLIEVDFSSQAQMFTNINTAADLKQAAVLLAQTEQ